MANNKVILIVDDEADILDILEFELEDLGYSIRKAQSGNKAIELFKTRAWIM